MIVARVKGYLEQYTIYLLAREVKWSVETTVRRFKSRDRKLVCLEPVRPSKGNVLLSYIIDPFLLKRGEAVSHGHSVHWESLQIARTFLELGYCVDVIYNYNEVFVPMKDYCVVIDARRVLERIAPFLKNECVRIMHIDSCHMLYHNAAEARRLLELQKRRGITLPPRRFEMPNYGIEHADYATVLGNEFTMSTFAYAKKPLYRVPISSAAVYEWPEGKDYEGCRRRYLWIGSAGFVHKGLDLVLEAFAGMPDYYLTVCGPIERESDFERAYAKELYETPNIRTLGWVDVASAQFRDVARSCVGIVYASCAEGGGGSVITCMHAGLVPIVSREASVDVEDNYGVILRDCSIEEIRRAVQGVSILAPDRLETMARNAWRYARAHHTREVFAGTYRKVVEEILANHRGRV